MCQAMMLAILVQFHLKECDFVFTKKHFPVLERTNAVP